MSSSGRATPLARGVAGTRLTDIKAGNAVCARAVIARRTDVAPTVPVRLNTALQEFGAVDAREVGQEQPRLCVTDEGEHIAVVGHAFEAGWRRLPAHILVSVEPAAADGALGIVVEDAFSEGCAAVVKRMSVPTLDALAVDDVCAIARRNTVRGVEGDRSVFTLDARHTVSLGTEGAGTADPWTRTVVFEHDRHPRASHNRHCAPNMSHDWQVPPDANHPALQLMSPLFVVTAAFGWASRHCPSSWGNPLQTAQWVALKHSVALHRTALARPVVNGLAPPAVDRVVLAGNHLDLRDAPRCSEQRPVSAQENVVPIAPTDVFPLARAGLLQRRIESLLALEADPLEILRAAVDAERAFFQTP